jgi:glycosyltransferase involved in cell wall biosynthesis
MESTNQQINESTIKALSAVIITYNEERNIARCLDSLAGVVDEVVVVDSFSTDGTEAICREKGARFLQRAFDGYGVQKNFALDQAAHDRVLSLDADEALSPALRASILAARADWTHDAYTMNRLTNYAGHWVRHGGWYPDRKLRLFDRRRARWTDAALHEKVEPAPGATVRHLAGDLLHYSYYSVEEHVERTRRYAAISARAAVQRGRRGGWVKVWLGPAATFLRMYFLKAGFLDGRAGWHVARISALETWWKYWEVARQLRGTK